MSSPPDDLSLREARTRAHALAMAPFAFQAACAARSLGVLAALRKGPLDVAGVASVTGLPASSVAALLEACLACDLVSRDDAGVWRVTRVGRVWQSDPQVHMDAEFTQHVCWAGLAELPDALRSGTPSGLRHLGSWPDIYSGLVGLQDPARSAWFAYDHGHSDRAFGAVLARLADVPAPRVLDVGGNTGRFSTALLTTHPAATVTLLDHPGQLALAADTLAAAGVRHRAAFHPIDLLQRGVPFPGEHDIVWISQVLDCFALEDVEDLLRRARLALAPGGEVWVLEACPDRQTEAAAATSLRLTSLYFVALANGVSRFYRGSEYLAAASAAGLSLVAAEDGLGTAHTLFRFRPAEAVPR